MKMLVQLKVRRPGEPRRPVKKKSMVLKKRKPDVAAAQEPPHKAIQRARQAWTEYWLDIGEFEVPEGAEHPELSRISGLLAGDVIRLVPLGAGGIRYADVVAAVGLLPISQEENETRPPSQADPFDAGDDEYANWE